MKKTIFTLITLMICLAVVFLIGTGFQKRTDVALIEYDVTKDGTSIHLEIQVSSSMGFVRGFKNNGGGIKPHYLTFYNTFGGLNSSLGAINSFTLEIEPDDTEIYFNRPNGGYELILQKDINTGKWFRPTK